MLRALFGTFLRSFEEIFYKKSVVGAGKIISPYVFKFFNVSFCIAVALVFVVGGFFELTVFTNYFLLFLVVVRGLVRFSCTKIGLSIYRNNKISVLIPYQKINTIITIIVSFFLFGDVSFVTLTLALLTVVVIVLFSVDLKSLKFPKGFSYILLNELSRSVATLILGYLLLSVSETTFFVLNTLFALLIVSLFLFRDVTIPNIRKLPVEFYKNRYLASILGNIGRVISLFLIKGLGLISSIMFGFLGMGITLIVSYFFLKDVPRKKDVLLACIVAALVGIGMLFK